MKCTTLVAAGVLAASLVACQRTAPTPVAKADPTTSGTADVGAFAGDWTGHGGEVTIDESGNGTETAYDNSTSPGTKTTKTFRITGTHRTDKGISGTYQGEAGSGTLTFFCVSDGGNLSRGDLVLDSWPLHIDTNDLDPKKHDVAIQAKRGRYCPNQQS